MEVNAWLHQSRKRLEDAGITTARLDCLILLEDATNKDRSWLLAHPEFELPAALAQILDAKIYRRARHIPLAYIRGKAEFYGRAFTVNAHTLVPRPETETMVNALKRIASVQPRSQGLFLVDIGTGSGAIAVTAKLELPGANVIATDIDEKCLETARTNAQKLGADLLFLHGNLLEPLSPNQLSQPVILLCNLPYVPDNFQINTAATHEPRHALFGGPDGLDLYRELFAQTAELPRKPHHILVESLPPQHEQLAAIAKAAGYALSATDDFIQAFERAAV